MRASRVAAGLAITAILLAGCSQAGDGSLEPTAEPTNPQATETNPKPTETAKPTDSAAPNQSPANPDAEPADIKAVVQASYELFEAQGMTETATFEGAEYALVFDPSIDDYQAALLNRATGESELIFETDYFTLFVIYLIAESETGTITEEAAGGYLAEDENYGTIRFFVSDGIVTAAEGEDQNWRATFEYSVAPELREVLLAERQALLDSFTE